MMYPIRSSIHFPLGVCLFMTVFLSSCYTAVKSSSGYYSEFGTEEVEEGEEGSDVEFEEAEPAETVVVHHLYPNRPSFYGSYSSYYGSGWGVGVTFGSPYYGYYWRSLLQLLSGSILSNLSRLLLQGLLLLSRHLLSTPLLERRDLRIGGLPIQPAERGFEQITGANLQRSGLGPAQASALTILLANVDPAPRRPRPKPTPLKEQPVQRKKGLFGAKPGLAPKVVAEEA